MPAAHGRCESRHRGFVLDLVSDSLPIQDLSSLKAVAAAEAAEVAEVRAKFIAERWGAASTPSASGRAGRGGGGWV